MLTVPALSTVVAFEVIALRDRIEGRTFPPMDPAPASDIGRPSHKDQLKKATSPEKTI